MKADQDRVSKLLTDTVTLLCKNGLVYNQEIKIQGLLGITLDSKDVFLVQINEVVGGTAATETSGTSTYGGASGEHGRRKGSNHPGYINSSQMTNAPQSVSSQRCPQSTSAMQRGDIPVSNLSHSGMCHQQRRIGRRRQLSNIEMMVTGGHDQMSTSSPSRNKRSLKCPSGQCALSYLSHSQQEKAADASNLPSNMIQNMTASVGLQRIDARLPETTSVTAAADATAANSKCIEEVNAVTVIGNGRQLLPLSSCRQTSALHISGIDLMRSLLHVVDDQAPVDGLPKLGTSANTVSQPVESEHLMLPRINELVTGETADADISCSNCRLSSHAVLRPTDDSTGTVHRDISVSKLFVRV